MTRGMCSGGTLNGGSSTSRPLGELPMKARIPCTCADSGPHGDGPDPPGAEAGSGKGDQKQEGSPSLLLHLRHCKLPVGPLLFRASGHQPSVRLRLQRIGVGGTEHVFDTLLAPTVVVVLLPQGPTAKAPESPQRAEQVDRDPAPVTAVRPRFSHCLSRNFVCVAVRRQ